jgi:hypothetical protein
VKSSNTVIDGYVELEFDLPSALLRQVVSLFDNEMKPAPLTPENIKKIEVGAQGVYQLIHEGEPVYIGKTDAEKGLQARLAQHAKKISGRKSLAGSGVEFKAIRIAVFAAMDLETQLIAHYGRPSWNHSGIGANDPGRERDTTTKKPEGFDSRFPIDIDLPLDFLPAGAYSVLDLLILLKSNLLYLLRFETAGLDGRSPNLRVVKTPHDYENIVDIPSPQLTMREVMARIVDALPPGWQATELASRVILYRENREYPHGRVIAPRTSSTQY